MASRTLSRALLILALIVAAHAFKPISSKSVVDQLLGAAESLSFVLPDFAEVRLAQASYLAAAFAQGERSDTPETRAAQTVPAAFELEQVRQPCGRNDAGPVLAQARTARSLVARTSKPKPAIPQLPEAMPLSEALAMTVPLGEVELRMLPVVRIKERQLLRRALLLPTSMRPMLPVRKQKVAECDAISIGSPDGESDLSNTVGPQEEELDLWDFSSAIETFEAIESEPPTATPTVRTCAVEVPAVTPLPLQMLPHEYE
jgi:hypothetical protein